MNRRKPVLDIAVVPIAPGEDATMAVLRKAAGRAVEALAAQREHVMSTASEFSLFFAGYLAGYARHQALKHGVDAETLGGALIDELRRSLCTAAPDALEPALCAIQFGPRPRVEASPRASLRAIPPLADAGYLAGHLESACGTRKLVREAIALVEQKAPPADFLTACDIAADPMQTRQPTLSLRFDVLERAVIEEAFGTMRASHHIIGG
ncbi:hypothetical protein [Aestuariivirga sp.]|uniref:hypothetical protein n=1 Tax=Aestuariivirga sp. TaxID=2650926 RepID=UPI00391C9DBE